MTKQSIAGSQYVATNFQAKSKKAHHPGPQKSRKYPMRLQVS